MTHSLIEAKNTVFIDVHPRKKYLTDEKHTKQNAQKGNTCWFYAFSVLRPRIGKIPKPTGEAKEQTHFAVLQAKRKSEKIISQFRKAVTALDECKNAERAWAKESYTPDEAKPLLRTYQRAFSQLTAIERIPSPAKERLKASLPTELAQLKLSDLEKDIAYLESYAKQTEYKTMASFSGAKYLNGILKSTKEAVKQLGRDVDAEIEKYRLIVYPLCTRQKFKIELNSLPLRGRAGEGGSKITSLLN